MKDWRRSPEPAGMMGPSSSSQPAFSLPPPSSTLSPSLSSSSSPPAPPMSPHTTSVSAANDVWVGSHPRTTRTGKADISLADLVRRVIMQKLYLFDSFGSTNFALVKPILEQCPATKLFSLEEQSPHLLAHTEYIWKRNCLRDYKDAQRIYDQENAKCASSLTWRELYRSKAEADLEAKEAATAKIKQKYAMLRADKAAAQVRVVQQTPVMRTKRANGFHRHAFQSSTTSQGNLTTGQRMLSKARKQASFKKTLSTPVIPRGMQRSTASSVNPIPSSLSPMAPLGGASKEPKETVGRNARIASLDGDSSDKSAKRSSCDRAYEGADSARFALKRVKTQAQVTRPSPTASSSSARQAPFQGITVERKRVSGSRANPS